MIIAQEKVCPSAEQSEIELYFVLIIIKDGKST
jgi:hypothetical protein